MTGRVTFVLGGELAVALDEPSPGAVQAAGRVLGAAPVPGQPDCDLLVRWQPAARQRTVSDPLEDGPRTLTLPVRDADGVPALRSVAFLTLIERGIAPVHAATGIGDDQLVAFAGPSGAGKTGLLLAAANRGLRPWAAEWILVGPSSVLPLEHAIRIRARHVADDASTSVGIAPGRRSWLRAVGSGARAAWRLGHTMQRLGWEGGPGRRITRLGMALGRRAYVDVPLALAGASPGPIGLQARSARRPALGVLLLLCPNEDGPTSIARITATDAAGRLTRWLGLDLDDLTTVGIEGAGTGATEPWIQAHLESSERMLADRLAATDCLVLEADPATRASELAASVAQWIRLGE